MNTKKKILSLALALSLVLALSLFATTPVVVADESAGDPLASASSWAREGITAAIDKGFVPEEIQNNYKSVITRAEFCRMAVKWLEYRLGKSIDEILADQGLARDPNAFTDTDDPIVLAAFALGVTNGTGHNLFSPNGEFSREQAATMIRNTCKAAGMDVTNTADAGFADIGAAGSWAVGAINFVGNHGIMSGTGHGNFSPKMTYTREQSIVTFHNIEYPPPVTPTPEPTPEPTPASDDSEFERQVLLLVNIERENHGIGPLVWDEALAAVARAHSIDMVQRGYFSHTCPDGVGPFDRMRNAGITYRTAGENIAAGYRTPEAVLEGWMNSPGHRDNILNESFTRLGVGLYQYHWTQKFAG